MYAVSRPGAIPKSYPVPTPRVTASATPLPCKCLTATTNCLPSLAFSISRIDHGSHEQASCRARGTTTHFNLSFGIRIPAGRRKAAISIPKSSWLLQATLVFLELKLAVRDRDILHATQLVRPAFYLVHGSVDLTKIPAQCIVRRMANSDPYL